MSKVRVRVTMTLVVDLDGYRAEYGENKPVALVREEVASDSIEAVKQAMRHLPVEVET